MSEETKQNTEPEEQQPAEPVTAKLAELSEAIQNAATKMGWKELMPVQAKSVPLLASGCDAMIQSRTGSGKTGGFLLPLMDRIKAEENTCQTLILVPTRELAVQVGSEAEKMCEGSGIRTIAVYGGVGYKPQIDAFKEGAHIVIGTPGRILDHLLKRSLSLDTLKTLIFDEADRMLSMGFYPDMCQIKRYIPKRGISSWMFSATFPPHVLRLTKQFMHEPKTLSLSTDHVHVTDTEHVYYNVPGMQKDRTLVRIIEMENPASAIIFCNTKASVKYVATVLQRFGYDAEELSSDLSQNAREKVLGRIREGKLRFLVATDVAARGIDIPEISHVVQYEPPEDPEAYIHRAGRTGRAGASGQAITLVYGVESLELNRIAKRFKIEMQERTVPEDEDVEAIVAQRLTALLEAKRRDCDRMIAERMRRFIPLAKALNESEDESELIAMLLDEYYQKILHAPVAAEVDKPESERKSGGEKKKGRRPRRRR